MKETSPPTPPDLTQAAAQLAAVVSAVSDADLTRPTPCDGWDVARLLDHLFESTLGLKLAAEKAPPMTRGTELPTVATAGDWRGQLSRQATDLAHAWKDPDAWTGAATAGTLKMPGSVLGAIALSELALHTWDLAAATQAPATFDPETVEVVGRYVEKATQQPSKFYGPRESLSGDDTALERVLRLSGRNPAWSAPS